jgi:hypothetical protein
MERRSFGLKMAREWSPVQVVIVEEWDQSVKHPSYLVRKCQGALSVVLIGYLNGYLVYVPDELLIIVGRYYE